MPSKKAEIRIPAQTGAARVKELRDWIDAADRQGAQRCDLVLRLTARDAAMLKRHPSVGVDEIAFAAGEMRFLGVKVEEGGVSTSSLEPHG